ncbi:alpha/beta hydrolase family protein [Jatrophihabitans fulvus]
MPAPSAVALRAADGTRLIADHHPSADRRIGCVVAHGFTGWARNADVLRITDGLTRAGFGVLALDFRGHGRSDGHGTAGRDEIEDVAAAVAWLRGAGYGQVAVLGWSMGGSAVLRYAGLGGDADAVVSVSSPGTWYEKGTRSMRVVHRLIEHRGGRVVLRLLRNTRMDPRGWPEAPEAPADVAGSITSPLLVVHGDDDHYFPARHVDAIAQAAPGATVWREAGMAHAEAATTADLVARIASWLRTSLGTPAPTDLRP